MSTNLAKMGVSAVLWQKGKRQFSLAARKRWAKVQAKKVVS
jgi:hypothetical protein